MWYWGSRRVIIWLAWRSRYIWASGLGPLVTRMCCTSGPMGWAPWLRTKFSIWVTIRLILGNSSGMIRRLSTLVSLRVLLSLTKISFMLSTLILVVCPALLQQANVDRERLTEILA